MGFDHRSSVSSPHAAPPSLVQRLRSSICSSCCFVGAEEDERPASLMRSSANLLRHKAQDIQEIGGRCRNLVARIGRHHHTRRASGDFKYDPLSYALNFDEGPEKDDDLPGGGDDFRYRSFSSRLPHSPPLPAAVRVAG